VPLATAVSAAIAASAVTEGYNSLTLVTLVNPATSRHRRTVIYPAVPADPLTPLVSYSANELDS